MECYVEILCSKNISLDLIYHKILPYIPHMELTQSALQFQKNKLKLYASIRRFISIEDDCILTDILKNYKGESKYYYQDEYIFLFLNIDTFHYSIKNYFILP